jgi:hypothetical protein
VPIPEVLPAVAIGQVAVYRLEVALLVFYGGLLLITASVSGIVGGRLPIEISTRGAKFAGETDQAAGATRAAIEKLEAITAGLDVRLIAAGVRINRIEKNVSDSRQPAIGSADD